MVRNVVSLLLAGVAATILAVTQMPAVACQPIREVVGGDLAPQGRFPWMVRLSMGCGGALTSPTVVLTAGHCVDRSGLDRTIGVIAGVADLKSGDAIRATSVRVVRSPDFRTETSGDDWALIKLDRALDLPVLELTRGTAGDRGTYTILGWGQTGEHSQRQQTRLRYATVPSIPDADCARAYRKAGVTL